MFRKIYMFFLQKKLLKQYYDEQAEIIMGIFLKNEKGYVGIYDKKGKMKEIRKLEVINKWKVKNLQ